MADALFELRVRPVEIGAELGRPAQVGPRGEDAEAATEPRHAGGIGPVRRLAGIVDDAEDVVGGEIEDRQPVEPGPAGPGIAVAALPGGLPGARGTLVGAQPHRVHKTAGKARMAPEVMAQLALDRSTLGRASAPSNRCGRELAPFLDALEKRFAGRDGRENERHAVGNRRFDKS